MNFNYSNENCPYILLLSTIQGSTYYTQLSAARYPLKKFAQILYIIMYGAIIPITLLYASWKFGCLMLDDREVIVKIVSTKVVA